MSITDYAHPIRYIHFWTKTQLDNRSFIVSLQHIAAKTEIICFGSKTTLRQSLPGAQVLTINDVVLQPVEAVRDLGVLS